MDPTAVIDFFHRRFGEAPALLVRAPGRINLIGEHTDYNQGWVLPAAIDRSLWLAVGKRADLRADWYALDYQAEYKADLSADLVHSDQGWPNYLLGVYSELRRDGMHPQGINLVFGGDIPPGAGLSSSAALESGLLFALDELFHLGLSRPQMALLAQRCENNFVGVQVGIMDMFAILHGRQDHVLRLDCRTLDFEYFPFHAPDHSLVLCDTQVKHALVDSEFNNRRRECETGVQLLQARFPEIRSLRDVTLSMLEQAKTDLPEVIHRRCRYVIEENARLEAACQALETNRLTDFGQLLYRTHAGLRDEYEVSCPELDVLVEAAHQHPAVLGARMMGGGFGGCTLNLVEKNGLSDFQNHMVAAYRQAFSRDLPVWPVRLMDGVMAEDL